MGARNSKRSVDITSSPKKGDSPAEGEGRVEKLKNDLTTNGDATHHAIEENGVAGSVSFFSNNT